MPGMPPEMVVWCMLCCGFMGFDFAVKRGRLSRMSHMDFAMHFPL